MSDAIAYLRVSGKGQAADAKTGLPRQRQLIQDYAAAQGFDVVETFTEVYTGTTLKKRDALGKMMVWLPQRPGVATVLVENADRLARDRLVGLMIVENLREIGVDVVTSDGSDLSDDSPQGKLMTAIFFAIAGYDKEMKVLRMKWGRDARSEALGRRVEGRKPWADQGIQAELVALVQSLRARGLSLRRIAEYCNASTRGQSDGSRVPLTNATGGVVTYQLVGKLLRAYPVTETE